MKTRSFTLILTIMLITSHAQAEPWWENQAVQNNLTTASINVEFCGDGIDNDGDGSQLMCPGDDPDMDGYDNANDCAPDNKFVYPGISAACQNGGWQTCQTNGTFTSCIQNSVQPLCEATGSGKCYYVDHVNGNDTTGDGSYANPWKTYLKFSTPDTYKPQPGDVFYFMNGTYSETDNYGWQISNQEGTVSAPIIYKNYPGHHPVIKPVSNGTEIHPVTIYNSKYIQMEGFEITQTSHSGIGIAGGAAEHIKLRNLYKLHVKFVLKN